ncbi:glycolipid anchored surface protein [Phlyctema vagabunda]|uniref:1,3-beta-glucanosyltransferase n=1 Tax=Phlyctema vagabunda TaxID=108571 RepID=A0ABR4PVS1_9HELO
MIPARSLSLFSLLALGVSATLDPIVIKGSKFFYSSNGTQFFIKGVAYQADGSSTDAGYIDPLSDEKICARDVPYLQKAGANLIRTYAIDPTQDHSACMKLLDDAGIYVISDLGEPNLSIQRTSPAWNVELYARYTAVVDALANYTNVVGFFAGNEVSNNASYTGASAFVKAAVRDTKAYIKDQGYHSMGVGYAADDDATVRFDVANYFNCGDEADIIDFWGYNIYEWCGDSDYETSGYSARTAEFANYTVPVFFAEYGCNTPDGAAGRKFTEVEALYGSDMSEVFSGGIVYEYFQEDNDYGLVSVDGDSVSTLSDYNAWATEIASVTVTGVNSASYTPTNTVQQDCPAVATNWLVSESGLPPTPNQAVCDCMVSSLTCKAKAGISSEDIGTLFAQVCGYNDGKPCAGVTTNTSTGVYGEYSMCNSTQQLSYAFNEYYLEQGSSDACDFDGNAESVSAAATAASCSSVLSQASATGTGSSSGGAAASASSTKSSAADALYTPRAVTVGGHILGLYAMGSVMLGAAMILL